MAVIAIRIVWVFPLTYVPRWLFQHARGMHDHPPWQHPLMVAWSGMRGAVSLAAALAIPLRTDAGTPFPERDLIIFITFCVILATLVLQGLTLPWLIRHLDVGDEHERETEESKARLQATRAALARLDELENEDWVRDDTAERMRALLGYRKRRFAARFDGDDEGHLEKRSLNYQHLQREILEAQRGALAELRRAGKIDDEVMRRVQRDLDLEDRRLEI